MELFLLELWRGDGLAAVRCFSPVDSPIGDPALITFVNTFSNAIQELVDWQTESLSYKDSEGDMVTISGSIEDGILEAAMDASAHWPYLFKVSFDIVPLPLPPVVFLSTPAADSFPDVAFPELNLAKVDNKDNMNTVVEDSFHQFLLELERKQEEIQMTLRRSSRELASGSLSMAAFPRTDDPFEAIATNTTRMSRRMVPGTPLDESRTPSYEGEPLESLTETLGEEMTALVERVERQLSSLSIPAATATTQTEKETVALPRKENRVATYKRAQNALEGSKGGKKATEPKIVLLKQGKLRQFVHRTEEGHQIFSQSIRVINLSRTAVTAQIIVTRHSTNAKGVLPREFISLPPFCPTKFVVGLTDSLVDEDAFCTFQLHSFTSPISPSFSVFAPVRVKALPPPPPSSSRPVGKLIDLESAPMAGALVAPPKAEVPSLFTSCTLKLMLTGRSPSQEEIVVKEEVEGIVNAMVEKAVESAKEEETKMEKPPMFIIEETAEDEREKETREEEEEEGGEEEEVVVEVSMVDALEWEESDSDYEVISSLEAEGH